MQQNTNRWHQLGWLVDRDESPKTPLPILKMDLPILGYGQFWKIKLETFWVGTREMALYLFDGKKFNAYSK